MWSKISFTFFTFLNHAQTTSKCLSALLISIQVFILRLLFWAYWHKRSCVSQKTKHLPICKIYCPNENGSRVYLIKQADRSLFLYSSICPCQGQTLQQTGWIFDAWLHYYGRPEGTCTKKESYLANLITQFSKALKNSTCPTIQTSGLGCRASVKYIICNTFFLLFTYDTQF